MGEAENKTKMASQRGLDQKAVWDQTGWSWVRSSGDWGKGQSSGNSDIIEESDKLVTNGEGDRTAQDLEGKMNWNKNCVEIELRKFA